MSKIKNYRNNIWISFFIIISCCFAAYAKNVVAGEDLRKALNNIQTMQANFAQTVYGANGKVLQVATGKMDFKKPNLFRWEILTPDHNLLMTNGTTLWNYDETLEQVVIKPFDMQHTVSPISCLFADPTENFSVQQLSTNIYKLTPLKENSSFKYLELTLANSKLKSLKIDDHLDQVTVFDFTKVKNNLQISDSKFIFNPPSGTDIIREQ